MNELRPPPARHGELDTYEALDTHGTVADSATSRLATDKLNDAARQEGTTAAELAAPEVHAAVLHAGHELIRHHHPLLAMCLRTFIASLADGLHEQNGGF